MKTGKAQSEWLLGLSFDRTHRRRQRCDAHHGAILETAARACMVFLKGQGGKWGPPVPGQQVQRDSSSRRSRYGSQGFGRWWSNFLTTGSHSQFPRRVRLLPRAELFVRRRTKHNLRLEVPMSRPPSCGPQDDRFGAGPTPGH